MSGGERASRPRTSGTRASPESPPPPRVVKGRGASSNPVNRFERLHVVADGSRVDPDDPSPRTKFLRDSSRSILSRNDSPDVAFGYTLNPYRGCEHGCIYCYARPTHEYLGFSAGLDFETKILVKHEAPTLLRAALSSPRWTPAPIAMSGVTDPYQPVERRLRLTRGCIQVLAEFRNPLAVVTKNHLVTRDTDLLAELAARGAATVALSVTTLRPDLQRVLEPRTATPDRRLDAIRSLTEAGVPVRVMVAPVIPGLTDQEIPAILAAAAEAGARAASYSLVRLPHGVREMFADWLEAHVPQRRDRVLNRIRDTRRGRLHDSCFGRRMTGDGAYADHVRQLFETTRRKHRLHDGASALSAAAFRRPPPGDQLGLFDD